MSDSYTYNTAIGFPTSHPRTTVPKVCCQLLAPTPLSFLVLPALYNPHSPSNLTLHRPHPAAPLLLSAFNVRRHHESRPLDPPLCPLLLHPKHRFARSAPTAPLYLPILRRMPRRTREQLPHLLHPYIRGKSRHVGIIHPRVLRRVVVLVLRQLGPHAAVDAVAEAGDVGRGGSGVGGIGRG